YFEDNLYFPSYRVDGENEICGDGFRWNVGNFRHIQGVNSTKTTRLSLRMVKNFSVTAHVIIGESNNNYL
ncbi:MAG: hypothetical protein OEY25_14220, partial [Candidatus Aminicenantes bacterium]|nr:hypothetical protein [Candidatus Aminicenantes bacterium]